MHITHLNESTGRTIFVTPTSKSLSEMDVLVKDCCDRQSIVRQAIMSADSFCIFVTTEQEQKKNKKEIGQAFASSLVVLPNFSLIRHKL